MIDELIDDGINGLNTFAGWLNAVINAGIQALALIVLAPFIVLHWVRNGLDR